MSTTIQAVRWKSDTIDRDSDWYLALDGACLAALDRALATWRASAQPITSARPDEGLRAAWRGQIENLSCVLEQGRGFAILDRLPLERYSREDATAAYWLIGCLLAEPFEQNVEGTLLYDVRDTGKALSEGARFSVTSYESSFHTDNSFGDRVLDYVGLLCLQAARSGGVSQLVHAATVHEELQRRDPQALEILSQPFHVDRRGGVRERESPTVERPVFETDKNGDVLVRYLRYWIDVGHQKVNQPLSEAQRHALDTLDQILAEPALRINFLMEPGQIQFINNRWLFHNRTAFEDHPEIDRRRHYVRLWLHR
jgi:alpha-ketoglutarate-dependent taurine dioxygenase